MGWGTKCFLVKNDLLIGVIWGTSREFQCPLPGQPDYGKALGICILASISLDLDAPDSYPTQKHFSFMHLLFGGQE